MGTGAVAALVAVSLVGQAHGRPGGAMRLPDVLSFVAANHVDPVDERRMWARALEHGLTGLDAYSHFMSAEGRKRLAEAPAGSGLTLARSRSRGDRWIVLAVDPGSPAARAGIAAGQVVTAIDGHAVADIPSVRHAQALLGGDVGRRVRLQLDEGPDIELALAPVTAPPDVESTTIREAGQTVAYVRIARFGPGTALRVRRALRAARRGARALDRIVLDLRGNPGGDVDQALVIADDFIAEGLLTRTRGRGGWVQREELAHPAGTDRKTPLRVLVDSHSASASELLAVALQDHGRAEIVGEHTYGKGTVQRVVGLEDGSQLVLTVARYFSPNDQAVDGVGVKPDRPVDFSGADADARARVEALRGA